MQCEQYLLHSVAPHDLLREGTLEVSVPHYIIIVPYSWDVHLSVELINVLLIVGKLVELWILVLVPPVFKGESDAGQGYAHEDDDEYATWRV